MLSSLYSLTSHISLPTCVILSILTSKSHVLTNLSYLLYSHLQITSPYEPVLSSLYSLPSHISLPTYVIFSILTSKPHPLTNLCCLLYTHFQVTPPYQPVLSSHSILTSKPHLLTKLSYLFLYSLPSHRSIPNRTIFPILTSKTVET